MIPSNPITPAPYRAFHRRLRGRIAPSKLRNAADSDGARSAWAFSWGLLHGFLILFSFIASLFTDFRIYAFPNSGGWYDFGFLLGAMSFLGGGGASARK